MKILNYFLLSLFYFSLFSCSDKSTNVNNNDPVFNPLPLKVGNIWIYTETNPNGTNERTNKINGTQEINGNSIYVLNDDWLFDNDGCYENDGKLYGLKISNPTSSLEVVFPKNPRINQTWMVDEKTLTLISTNDNVIVPAGSFDCYKIDVRQDTKQFYIWFAKDIGIVKIESEEFSSVLKNYLIN